MDNLNEFFQQLLDQHRSLEIAEIEFKRMMSEDPELSEEYREWCAEQGYNPKSGFKEYCEQYIDELGEKWDSLSDFDE